MLDQIVKKYTLKVVMSRTKISKRNLEKLASGQFEEFTKPQAYGFLKILEREFKDEDFSELRTALDAWNWQSYMDNDIFLDTYKEAPSNKKWIIILLIAIIASMIFYLFQQEFSTQESINS